MGSAREQQHMLKGDSEVTFQILSHAGLRVNAGGKELITDPWLVGSCYWRSWWNYPPVQRSVVESLHPDFIYLSHLHWDHFHAPSLRRFDPDIPIIIPYDRYDRAVRDLRSIGRKNIIELKHGERIELAAGLVVRCYHVSPFMTDSAVAIEAGNVVLLNVNDAKFAGAPLRQILRDYPDIDFCFRSHSSANARACFHEIGREDVLHDDNSHYVDVFTRFMVKVKPRYAIPFASNNCLLHDDTFAMNALVQTPLTVERHFADFLEREQLATEIRLMVSGDSWSSLNGFSIAEHDYFTNRETHLEAYRQRVAPTLARHSELEARTNITLATLQKFFGKLAKDTPRIFRRKLRDQEILLLAHSSRSTTGFAVDLWNGLVRAVDPSDVASFTARIECPTFILRQAVLQNMFSHAAISKRVHYFATPEAMLALRRFVAILDWSEGELIPVRKIFTWRAAKALLPRWREGLLYAQSLQGILNGKSLPAVERDLLSS